jgi:hypothetical protein
MLLSPLLFQAFMTLSFPESLTLSLPSPSPHSRPCLLLRSLSLSLLHKHTHTHINSLDPDHIKRPHALELSACEMDNMWCGKAGIGDGMSIDASKKRIHELSACQLDNPFCGQVNALQQ